MLTSYRAVTAVLKGHTERGGTTILLRSYPSRTQPAVEPDCTIWQAGRATCATKLAFKEIRIGTSTFLDEGYGLLNSDRSPTYNPAPQMLDEAQINEWPGQPIGLLLSVGTGKRPGGTSNMQQEWWEGFAGGLGNFAEAKRKLIAKIEGCEKTHREMLSIHLPKRGVNPDNYLRLNVEVGVGEFGMNEWNRLADISNNTQAYLNTPSVKVMLNNGAMQMAKVETMRRHLAARVQAANDAYNSGQNANDAYGSGRQSFETAHQTPQSTIPPPDPFAVELPGGDLPPAAVPQPLSRPGPQYPGPRPVTYPSAPSSDEKYTIIASDDFSQLTNQSQPPSNPQNTQNPSSHPPDYQPDPPYRAASDEGRAQQAPPLPPKTPINFHGQQGPSHPRRYASHPQHSQPPPQGSGGGQHFGQHSRPPGQPPPLPYPDNDEPPPPVNVGRKPEFVGR